ncbi:MAG: RNA polymerase sigma factor [Pseudohongiella sp.]|nr:RNA polymerase sigma factor [Pseudohongiella sp.]
MRDLKQRSFNEWLIIRCQQGERDAFTALVKAWERRYYLYALNRLEDREAAKDVTQDCLLSISRSLGTLSDPAAFPKWSFRILERRCIDWLRKTIRERALIQQQENLPDIGISDDTEDKLNVEQLLAKLDSRLATILKLYYLESLSIDEIAEISDVPPGTVKSRLFYARKLMMKALEE